MTDQPNETETPHGETITHLGGYQLPYWDEDTGWPGAPFPGRWVAASRHITGAVNAAASFLDNGTVGTLRVWVGKTDTETGETWRVWGLTDRPVSATLYRDRDDQTGIHAVFVPAKPAQPAPDAGEDRLPGQVAATVQLLTTEQARTELPDLFIDDPDDGQCFNELPAHGNACWVDYWPGLVLVVRNPIGAVVTAGNASRWHLEALGYGEHLPAEDPDRCVPPSPSPTGAPWVEADDGEACVLGPGGWTEQSDGHRVVAPHRRATATPTRRATSRPGTTNKATKVRKGRR